MRGPSPCRQTAPDRRGDQPITGTCSTFHHVKTRNRRAGEQPYVFLGQGKHLEAAGSPNPSPLCVPFWVVSRSDKCGDVASCVTYGLSKNGH